MKMKVSRYFVLAAAVGLSGWCLARAGGDASNVKDVLTGSAAFTDYSKESPGTFRKITVADLPKPFDTRSAPNNPEVIDKPADAWPKTLPGFKVERYAEGLDTQREIRTAPNVDLFVA